RFRRMQQHQDAPLAARKGSQRGWNRPRMRAAAVIDQVDHGERLMHADEGLELRHDLTARERQMRRVGELVPKRHQTKMPFCGPDGPLADTFNQPFGLTAVM